MRAGYFEGVLQLRNPTQELINFVRNKIKRDNRAVISMEESVRGGIDLYVSSQHYLQNIGLQLKKQFPGELKISKRLYSRSSLTSRELYRVSVLFRLSNLRIGQGFKYLGKEHKVVSLGKRVMLKELRSGKKRFVEYEALDKYKV